MITLAAIFTQLIERDMLPDRILRKGIRHLLRLRLREESAGGPEVWQTRRLELIEAMRNSPIAIATDRANTQHYEVPTRFFELCLGKHLKYSCALWNDGTQSLNDAEDAMLALTCERARLEDGQSILDLGCGWGSLSLYMAMRFPNSDITAVSNSQTQREFIETRARALGLRRLRVLTVDANSLQMDRRFDRIVSVEMFEHMRNAETLMARIASWMEPESRFFMHIFCHNRFPYFFEVRDETDWMARHFFTGGMMPSADLPLSFQRDLECIQRWDVNGVHYQKTAEAWLDNMDRHKAEILDVLKTRKMFAYWRVFFMTCAELFGYQNGEEWLVCHYVFMKTTRRASTQQL
jgi:cyclopropane-fatty-acyl-phospholipid synthase